MDADADDVRFGGRSGGRDATCGSRARRAREADRRSRCELAGLVRRVHGGRAGGQGAAAIRAGRDGHRGTSPVTGATSDRTQSYGHEQPHPRLLRLVSIRPDGHPARDYVVERLRRRGDDVELIDARRSTCRSSTGCTRNIRRARRRGPRTAGWQDPRRRRLRVRHWRIQLGRPARTEEPHRSFPRGVVLAAAAIVSYSAGRLAGARAATAWHGTLSEMGWWCLEHDRRRPDRQTLSAEGEPLAKRQGT